MNRLFDVIAVFCVAVVVLLPKASVEAKPALNADTTQESRIAGLEDAFARDPHSEPIAVELADAYLEVERPDWALVTLSAFSGDTSSARVSLVRATAHADRLEAPAAVTAIHEGEAACAAHGCPAIVAARLQLIGAPMQALVDGKIDPHTDLLRAKEVVGKALHSTRAGLPHGVVPNEK
jgi:hypothetical protein